MTTPDRERFDTLAPRFAGAVESVRGLDEPAFVRGDWAQRAAALVGTLLPVPPADFLRRREILFQMFVGERYLARPVRAPDPRGGHNGVLARPLDAGAALLRALRRGRPAG